MSSLTIFSLFFVFTCSESLSVQCFHWVLTRMQHDMDMIISDKKQARVWAKRLHVALQVSTNLKIYSFIYVCACTYKCMVCV